MTAFKPTGIRPLVMPGTPEVVFSAERDGVWQKIPASVADGFGDADVIINFGMIVCTSLTRCGRATVLSITTMAIQSSFEDRQRAITS